MARDLVAELQARLDEMGVDDHALDSLLAAVEARLQLMDVLVVLRKQQTERLLKSVTDAFTEIYHRPASADASSPAACAQDRDSF